jgi:hypothetical protein
MEKLYFLGLSQQQWEFINGFANWIAAIGTVAAVIISLYLALSSNKPKAKLSVGVRVMFTPGDSGPHPAFVVVKLVNLGDRPIHINSLGWKSGLFKKKYALQIVHATPFSQGLPVSLEHGKEAQWHIPTDMRDGGWYKYLASGFLLSNSKKAIKTLRIIAYTSTGHEFVAKPETSLIDELIKACEISSTG